MKRNIWCAMGIFTGLVGCGNKQPEDYLRADLLKLGFIPFEAPIAEAGTGTLVGASAKDMNIYAPPQRCFPDVDPQTQKNTDLRVLAAIDLPSRTSSYKVTGNARIGLVDALGKGTAPVKAGVQFDKAQAIEFSYSAPKREYIDAIKLISFYRTSMPGNYMDPKTEAIQNDCKDALDHLGYIREALMVDGMSFKFYSSNGGAIDLTVVDPNTLLEFGFGTTWQVSEKYELKVTTKKYIGYKMGQIRKGNGGSYCSANTVDKDGKYQFKCESLPADSGSKALGYAGTKPVGPSNPIFVKGLKNMIPIQAVYK